MTSSILTFLGSAIAAVFSWFDSIVTGDLWTLTFSFVVMALVVRFLILPFFGAGGVGASDKALAQKYLSKKQSKGKSKSKQGG